MRIRYCAVPVSTQKPVKSASVYLWAAPQGRWYESCRTEDGSRNDRQVDRLRGAATG